MTMVLPASNGSRRVWFRSPRADNGIFSTVWWVAASGTTTGGRRFVATHTAVRASAASPTDEQQHSLPKRVQYALLLGGLTAFGPLSIDMYLPALPTMTGDLATDEGTLQFTLTAFVVGLALGQLVVGPISDSFGRRRPLLIGLAVYVGASII